MSGALCVDGEVHGSIKVSGTLIVDKKGSVQGDIDAGEVQILGTVLGNIDCRGRVEISDGGRLKGEVRTPELIIADGGIFEGLSRSTADSTHVVLPVG